MAAIAHPDPEANRITVSSFIRLSDEKPPQPHITEEAQFKQPA